LTGSPAYQAGGSGFAISDYDNFLADTERLQGTLLGHYDLTEHIRFSGELWLSRDNGTNLAKQPYYNTRQFAAAGQPQGNLIISTANPYLSAADRQTIISNLADMACRRTVSTFRAPTPIFPLALSAPAAI
jgi:hypothetical protein